MNEQDRLARRQSQRRQRHKRRRWRLVALVSLALLVGMAIGFVRLVLGADDPAAEASARASVPRVSGGKTTVPGDMSVPARTPTRSAFAQIRGKVIVIDPGHNGGNYLHGGEINRQVNAGTLWKACDTTGTQTNDGYTEAEFTFDVARRLARILQRAGGRVVMTRTTNNGWGPCITERAAIGNRARADVGISIHADGGRAAGRGFHVIYPPSIEGLTDDIARDSRRLAIAIRNAYQRTGMPRANYVGIDGLNVRSDLGGLNLSDVPKVLFETGNMRNGTDADLLRSPAFRHRAATAIARGINAFLAT